MSASILDSLVSLFTVAIAGAFPNVPFVKAAVNPTSPKQEKFGDYQCNSSMQIAGMLKGNSYRKIKLDVLSFKMPVRKSLQETSLKKSSKTSPQMTLSRRPLSPGLVLSTSSSAKNT